MKYHLFLLFVCFSMTVRAQNYIDIASISYTNTPPNNFEDSILHTNIEELALNLNFPIELNDKSALLLGISTNKTTLALGMGTGNTTLNSLSLNLGIYKKYSKKWSAIYIVLPKIASDKGSIANDDFQFGLFNLFTYTKKENLKYKYGIYANTEKFGLFIVPIIGLYYVSPNKKFETNLTLPITGDFNYTISTKATLGMNFDGLGTTYNLHAPIYSANKEYVVKTSNELFTYVRFQLSKSIYLKTKLGYAITRSYKVFDANDKIDLGLSAFYFGDNRTQLNQNFATGAIFKAELLYRFHLN